MGKGKKDKKAKKKAKELRAQVEAGDKTLTEAQAEIMDGVVKGKSCAGKSIVELMWEDLDVVVARLMSGDGTADDGKDPGRAEGIAMCISRISNPFYPDLDSVRAEAMRRYEEGEAAPPEPDEPDEIEAEYV